MGKQTTAMSPTTAGCRIDVRENGQTYIARAAGLNITASCTCGAKAAAERCADKVFGSGNWEMFASDRCTFIGSRKIRPEDLAPAKQAKLRSVWRDPAKEMPDDEIAVLVRRESAECPVSRACHDENGWWPAEDIVAAEDVVGWMELHEAAQILDFATREVGNG